MGSGVLLRIADASFLLSAAHVLAEVEKALLLIGPMVTDSRLIPSPTSVQVTNDREALDVGYARLSPEVVTELEQHGKKFVRLSEFALGDEPARGLYGVIGYPASQNRPNYQTRLIDTVYFYYGSHLTTTDSATPGASIVVACTQPTLSTARGDEHMPELKGISGCGMWRLYCDRDRLDRLGAWDTSWIRLAGIEHTVQKRKWIKGTVIQRVIEHLRHDHADLRPSIRLVLPD